jgi:serine/threonine protein kinase
VYLCQHKKTGRYYAVKTINAKSREHRRRVEKEVNILWQLQHSTIVKLHQVFEKRKSFALVMDFARGMSLAHYLSVQKRVSFDEAWYILI